MTTDSTPTPAEPLKPHQPEEVQMLDMGEFMQAVHVRVNDPEWPEFQAWREAQAKHSNVTPWCAWQERARRATPAAAEIAQPAAPESELLQALEAASEWISDAPHGDDCFVSDHYPGDPGNRCNCGKDSIEEYLDGVIERATQAQPATTEPAEFSQWFGSDSDGDDQKIGDLTPACGPSWCW